MDLVWYARTVSALSRDACFRQLPSGRELLMAKYRDFTNYTPGQGCERNGQVATVGNFSYLGPP